MTAAMVDRLFWRAGFGPTQAQRDAWTGKQAGRARRLVPQHAERARRRPTTPPKPLHAAATPIDPTRLRHELELEWIDRMQRAVNPLPDRLAFFWHRHWAISRDDGVVPIQWVIDYRDRLLQVRRLRRQPGRDVPRRSRTR